MAVYKVPQDVEADDKLIVPFSFRQFIYLIIVAIAMVVAWFLSRVFVGLVLIPMPFIIFFGALALPLRKDQPMEIYLAAVIKFFLKPRIRKWDPEGQVNLVTIVAPHVQEQSLTKAYSADEAQQRLSYLAQVIDTQGWAARGVTNTAVASLNDTITAEASTVNDIMDETVGIGHQFDSLIEQQDAIRKQQMTQRFQTAMQQPVGSTPATFSAFPVAADEQAPLADPYAASPVAPPALPTFDPYPSSMHQHVVSPSGPSDQPDVSAVQPPPQSLPTVPAPRADNARYAIPQAPPRENPPISASDTTPSPDIMRLANNNDLSISAIAREAHRLEDDGEEVVISLR